MCEMRREVDPTYLVQARHALAYLRGVADALVSIVRSGEEVPSEFSTLYDGVCRAFRDIEEVINETRTDVETCYVQNSISPGNI